MSRSRKEPENWKTLAPDAIIGYTVIVLALVVFVIALLAIAAIARWMFAGGLA